MRTVSIFRNNQLRLGSVHVPSDILALFVVVAISFVLVFAGVRGRLE